jgi:hypothetical protein
MLSREMQMLRDIGLADFAKVRELIRSSIGALLPAEDRAQVTTMTEELEALYRDANTDDEFIIAFRTVHALTDEIKARVGEWAT